MKIVYIADKGNLNIKIGYVRSVSGFRKLFTKYKIIKLYISEYAKDIRFIEDRLNELGFCEEFLHKCDCYFGNQIYMKDKWLEKITEQDELLNLYTHYNNSIIN